MKVIKVLGAFFIMRSRYGLILIFALILPLQGLFALDIRVTEGKLGFNFTAEYNRTFHFCQDYAIFGGIELNNRYSFKAGAALGKIGSETEIKFLGSGRVTPFTGIPLNLNLSYIYNGLPGFQMHSHNILFYLSYDWRRGGIALGFNFRNTSFFGETSLFEPLPVYSMYFNFLNTDRFILGIRCSNFSLFYVGSLGQISFSLNGILRLNQHWSLSNELVMTQSGNTFFAATFYRFAYTGGLRFSW